MTRRKILLGVVLLLCGFAAFEAVTWPDVAALAREAPRTTAFVEAYRARAGRKGPELQFVPYARISSSVKRAVLVGEDINFFSHHGFEVRELRNAVEEAVEENESPRGASTITQQLAKNLWLSPSRNPWRKVKEAILTWQLERALDKRRILELYLNVVELGDGVYGIGPAARRYFGKAPSDLDDREAAQLAASLPRPRSWHPGSGSRAYARYVERILSRMERARFLERQVGGKGTATSRDSYLR
jgi:monofunctional biosynthetic peptidoglycan transglycosylase